LLEVLWVQVLDVKWEEIIEHPSVALITGRRGSGKTALGFYLLEHLSEVYDIPGYVVGLPEEKWHLLPENIHGIRVGEDLPEHAAIFCDESALLFYARSSMSELNKLMNILISISRQRDQTLIFASHTTRKLDVGIVLDCDALIFKRPSKLYARFERSEIREMVQHALRIFESINDNHQKYSVVFSHELDGELVTNPLPSFWCDELSRGFAGISPFKKDVDEKTRKKIEVLKAILEIEESGEYDKDFGWTIDQIPGLYGGMIQKLLAEGYIRRGYTSNTTKCFYGNTEKIREFLKEVGEL